jgi:hypothetical protein
VHVVLAARLHELCVALRVGCDNHDCCASISLIPGEKTASYTLTLCLKGLVYILEHLDRVRTTTFLLGVEHNVAFLGDPALDDVKQDRAKRLLHVGADPDEEPVVELGAGGEHGADARAGADTDALLIEVGEVW